MVESLAQCVGVVPVIGLQGLGERVTFCLKHQPHAIIIGQGVDECAGTAVGWNDKGAHGNLPFLAVLALRH